MKQKRVQRIDEDRIRKREHTQHFIYPSLCVFTDGLFACASLYDCLLLCLCVCVCVAMCMYHVWRLYFDSTMLHIWFISTRRKQRADRHEATSCCVFTAICSQFQQHLFCKTNQSCPPKDAEWETLVTCVQYWMVFQRWPSLSSRSSHTRKHTYKHY